MKVAAYQAPLLRTGSMAALDLIGAQVRCCESAGIDILCCPEAVLGGLADHSSRPADLAMSVASGQLQAVLGPLASDTVTTIVGFTEAGPGGQLFNSAAIFARGALAGMYRKMHPAIRRSIYQPGTAASVFRAGDLTFGIVICRDSTYPELVRSLAHQGAGALFVPTNNALPPAKGGREVVEHARRTDRRLATENGLAVIRADVAGRLDGLESYGSSWIIDNAGVTLRASRQLEPDLVVAEIQIRSGLPLPSS
jgi:predicted amidohydrolase